MTRTQSALLCLVPPLLLGSCGLAEPQEQRVLGVILERADNEANVPRSVTLGSSVDLTFHTFGNGSCVRAADTEISISGSTVTVLPYDFAILGVDCDLVLRTLFHPVSISFATPGEVTIVLRGHRAIHGDRVIEHRFTVTVQ